MAEQLSYYKGNRSFEDVAREEFAFSLIFNNIAPGKMSAALQSVGLQSAPNVFLLIQIDDDSDKSGHFSGENELVTKSRILDIVRAQLEKVRWEHMAASLSRTDHMIVFFCTADGGYEEELSHISQEICEAVHHLAGYAVSICISEPCQNAAQFSRNYEQAKLRLQESFLPGTEHQPAVIRTAGSKPGERTAEELDRCLQSIYVSLSRGNRTLFAQMLTQLFSGLPKNGQGRSQASLLAVWLIDQVEEYTRSCGVREGKRTAARVAKLKEEVLRCSHVDDICITLLHFYETMRELLDQLQGRSADSVFCEMVQQYIKDHYREKIYLEEIAASCGYSKYYFCRQFKKCFGIGLSDSVNRFRVERAKELMCSGYQSVEEIAHEVGFSSANYFEIVFRKSEGISPTAHKKSQKGRKGNM